VLDRHSEPVRPLPPRTSVLDRVSGELAGALTGGSGGGWISQELEKANAFVMSLDAARSWLVSLPPGPAAAGAAAHGPRQGQRAAPGGLAAAARGFRKLPLGHL
jgi:hypothetical protein